MNANPVPPEAPRRTTEARDETRSGVLQCIGLTVGVDVSGVDGGTRLLDIGYQSMDFVELAYRLERRFAVQIDRRYMVVGLHSIDDYVGEIEQLIGGAATVPGHHEAQLSDERD